MKYVAILENFNNKLWGHHVSIPKELVGNFVVGDNRRIRCTIENTLTIQCSLMPHGDHYFILVNQKIRDQLQLREGSKVELFIEKDTSTYGIDLPEEFEACLDQDESGKAYFHQLTPGKQRSLIYLITTVKNSNSRIRKSLAILYHLNESQGKLDFKRLNEVFKEFNRMR
jgi:hypothetical protein